MGKNHQPAEVYYEFVSLAWNKTAEVPLAQLMRAKRPKKTARKNEGLGDMDVSKNTGTPKCMIYNGKPY